MIISFADKDTEHLYSTGHSVKFTHFERVALRKLDMLNAAIDVNILRVPPGNHLEELKGDRAGQYSIRFNEKWRLCFRFDGGDAYDVEIVDYH